MSESELKDYRFSNKWSSDIEQYNFTQVPNLLLGCQGHLKLTDGELVVLIELLTFWYSGDGKVFPAIKTLTKFSGKKYSTLQKRLRRLEEKGFLKRIHRMNTSNTYDLNPCIKRLNEHQRICLTPPRSRSKVMLEVKRDPAYIFTKKEDEARKELENQTRKNILLHEYPDTEDV